MPRHYEEVGASAIHPIAFNQAIDPALDVDNEVEAGLFWFDTTEQRLKIRSQDNLAWENLGQV